MSVIIRAVVRLEPGCRLFYECPPAGISDLRETNEFYRKYGGKYATFIGYSEKLISILDRQGLLPGRYVDIRHIRVRFDDEEMYKLRADHFVVVDPAHATLVHDASEDQRMGDLLHPILFYPGDQVRLTEKPQHEPDSFDLSLVREVREVFLGKEELAPGGIPRYQVYEADAEYEARKRLEESKPRLMFSRRVERREWNRAGENLQLVSRGNVWALYNDPSKLSFVDDQQESEFWATPGISRIAKSGIQTPTEAYALFEKGVGDIVGVPDYAKHAPTGSYIVFKLNDCFGQHRERVRALTKRLYEPQLEQVVA